MRLLPALILALPAAAWAHKPSFSGDHTTAEAAWVVDDPDISIVKYQEITCETDQLWMSFEAEAGFDLFLQLGVPEIDRLTDYRPSVALLAPGLDAPPADLPFEAPEGLGALVWHAEDVEEPDAFYEPFTQTASWVWVEETVTLPEDGEGFLVAWHPEGQTGKLWVAVGTVEDFSDVGFDEFAAWSEEVNRFHETGKLEEVAPTEEQVCADGGADSGEAGAPGASPGAGCAVATGTPWALGALAGLLAVGRRRYSE